jgi:hypothetical protein
MQIKAEYKRSLRIFIAAKKRILPPKAIKKPAERSTGFSLN